jgi:hypothetical protein
MKKDEERIKIFEILRDSAELRETESGREEYVYAQAPDGTEVNIYKNLSGDMFMEGNRLILSDAELYDSMKEAAKVRSERCAKKVLKRILKGE